MEKVKIIFRDGVDLDRLQFLVEKIQSQKTRCIEKIKVNNTKISKDIRQNFYEVFGLQSEKARIEAIDIKIDQLKDERALYEKKIREFTKTKDCYYGNYDSIEVDSKVDKYIMEKIVDFSDAEHEIKKLINEYSDYIYLSKTSSEAIDKYSECIQKLNEKIVECGGVINE